jgi:hypothetical protein
MKNPKMQIILIFFIKLPEEHYRNTIFLLFTTFFSTKSGGDSLVHYKKNSKKCQLLLKNEKTLLKLSMFNLESFFKKIKNLNLKHSLCYIVNFKNGLSISSSSWKLFNFCFVLNVNFFQRLQIWIYLKNDDAFLT